MDKFEKILDIIDHQEKYSDEEIREILQDEECRKLYQTMVEVDSALENPSPIINVDEEWEKFSQEHQLQEKATHPISIANYFYPCLGLLTILRYSIQGLGYSNLSMLSGVMEMIARCGVSLWLVPALAWTGVCFGDPVAWVMADIFLIPAFLWLYKHLKKEQVR